METLRPNRPAALKDDAAGGADADADLNADNATAMAEQPRSRLEIEAIARELGLPVAQVAAQYAEEYARLEARAQVTNFLPVLVSRKLRASYQRAGAPEGSAGP